ncbi:hypothetical protein PRIPAC_72106 [Pristionchus pacificus]|uniref:Uncharacterized protein n=1 Tax=Pristionchus pacificus TaxID=54126 RepID=A0A2A6CFC3_PRIPA|nr:hypothetical protein PRIPAC_72106 [Pristionchus pacificus]|eukprot:PDM76753.1 hypothetical protein PRIPAC_42148 [Pristionchus pacificus]
MSILLCELALSLHDTQTETTVSTIRGSCQWSRDKLSASVTLTECTEVYAREREGRGRRRDEGTEVRSARDTVVTEVIPAKGIGMTEILMIYD